MNFSACNSHVLNRGIPPDGFLTELVEWARFAPVEIFLPNTLYDIYSSVAPELGPYQSILHRKAVMCEALRVLAGFESSWNWHEGRDTTNASSGLPCTEEAGIFQISGNAMAFSSTLRDYMAKVTGGATDCLRFIAETKTNHVFAIEFAARLLRFTTKHNGPVLRKEINPWLSRDAVLEFQTLLSA